MSRKWRVLCVVAGSLSSLLSIFAGIWILVHTTFDSDGAVATAMGFYFLGKAFFVGPLLIVTALRKPA